MVLAASRGRELPRQRPGGKKSFGEADRGLGWLVGISEGTLGPEALGGSGTGAQIESQKDWGPRKEFFPGNRQAQVRS